MYKELNCFHFVANKVFKHETVTSLMKAPCISLVFEMYNFHRYDSVIGNSL